MDTAENARTPAIPLSLFVFAVFYGGMVCIAGVLGNKQVALGPLAVEAGIFAFLLLVVTASATAELHGRGTANRLVLFGFIPLIASMILTYMVLAIPASEEMPGRSAVKTSEPRIVTYGERSRTESAPRLNQEYYESLKSLGYIR